MRKVLLFLSLFIVAASAKAQIVNIPNANFKAALLNHNPVINTNGDGEIQVSEALAFTGHLNVAQKNITNITGINAFVNITSFTCHTNPITGPFVLNNFASLQDLNIERTGFSSLQLTNLPALKNIYGAYAQYPVVSLSGLPALQHIEFYYSGVTQVSLANLPSLVYADFMQANVSSVSFTNLPLLGWLRLTTNPLTSVTISDLPALQLLGLDYNQLTSVSLINLPALTDLYINKNKLTSLSLSNMPMLRFLTCENNQLTSLQLDLPSLRILYCSKNQLNSLSFSSVPRLYHLSCRENKFNVLDLSSTKANWLECGNNPLLSYINLKNDTTSTFCEFDSLYQLASICSDPTEVSVITGFLNTQLPNQSVFVSSFCNFTPGNFNTIKGKMILDGNTNGCDAQDMGMNNSEVVINNNLFTDVVFTNPQGNYLAYTLLNTTTVTPNFPNNWFSATPASYSINFSTYGNTQQADFCITPVGIHPDAEIVLIPISPAAPGFNATYKLVYKNKGNQTLNGTITLNYDNNKLVFFSALPAISTQSAGTLNWTYSNLYPSETRNINITFKVNTPPTVNAGDLLSFTATIEPVSGDETPGDNVFHLNQTVVNSFDPNDKQVLEGPIIQVDQLNKFLHYMVRFQNTGTANAVSVVIKDSLSDKLDWNSFVPVVASHPYRTVVTKGNIVEFIFDGINLPPKSVNEPASNGFVAFQIKPKNNLVPGDIIPNKASIYFDFNQAIVTNTVTTTVHEPGNSDVTGLIIYSNPVKDRFSFTVKQGVTILAANLFNTTGQRINITTTESTSTSRKITVSNLTNGVYILEVITNAGRSAKKILVVK